jgi:hypothetical protein
MGDKNEGAQSLLVYGGALLALLIVIMVLTTS